MFQFSKNQVLTTRRGYLFSYAQMTFNQLRRYARLQEEKKDAENEREDLRKALLEIDNPIQPNQIPLGWRTFTIEDELKAEELEIRILAVLSAALFLEAFIFDYCARKESGSYAHKYLDKLDPVAKWAVIPRLVAPPGLDNSDEIFERMKRLFKARNELVHHKTKAGEHFDQPPEFPPGLEPSDCVQLIYDSLERLKALDIDDAFADFVLRHIKSWFKYTSKDVRFYPILWEA